MMLVILVRGLRNVRKNDQDTLQQMGLTRIFHAALVPENDQTQRQLHAVQTLVAYGPASEETIRKLQAKGHAPYRLHAPSGGFGSVKARFPNGAYGNYGDKINDLVQKMM